MKELMKKILVFSSLFFCLLFLHHIYCLAPGSFQNIPGNMTHVDIYNGGEAPNIIGIDDKGQAFLLNKDLKTWKALAPSPTPLKQVSIGKPTEKNEINAWGVDNQKNVYKYSSSKESQSAAWIKITGNLKQISVGNEYEVWGTDTDNRGWRKKDPQYDASSWQSLDGKILYLSAAADGTVWGIGPDDYLYNFNRFANQWIRLVKTADLGLDIPQKIDLKDKNSVVLINALKVAHHLIPGRTGTKKEDWVNMSENKTFTHISMGVDGTIIALDSQGKTFIRTPTEEEKMLRLNARGGAIRGMQMIQIYGGPNVNFAPLWTRASSPYDPEGKNAIPHNHMQLVCGGPHKQDQEIGNFFSFIVAGDPTSTRVLNYGDSVEILSLYATSGRSEAAGSLGKNRKWWSHFPHAVFKKDWADIPVSLSTHPQTQDGSQIFKIISPLGLTGIIHQQDAIKLVSQAQQTANRALIINPTSSLGKKFAEPIIPQSTYHDLSGNSDNFYGARDQGGYDYLFIKPINSIIDVPESARAAYKTLSGAFWLDAKIKEQEKKAGLTAVLTDGIGIVSSIKNETNFPLTAHKYGQIEPKATKQAPFELKQELHIVGFAQEGEFKDFSPAQIIQLAPMWSRGFAWIDSPFPTPNKTTLTFLARAEDAGSIQIVFDSKIGLDAQWKILIGGWNNTKSAILAKPVGESSHQIIAETLATKNLLARVLPGRFTKYWVSINDGFIMVGVGEVGTNVFLSAIMPQTLPISYCGFSSHDGPVEITEVQRTQAIIPLPQDKIYTSQKKDISLPATKGGEITWIDIPFRVPNEGAFSFEIEARYGVSLVLQNENKETYRVIIGDNFNAHLVLQKNDTTILSLNAQLVPQIQIIENSPQKFWISIQGGLITVGKGALGTHILLAWQDQIPLSNINRFGFEPADHIQKIRTIQFAPNVIFGNEKLQDINQIYLTEKGISGSILLIKPFDYGLIQTGQFVTLQDKLSGNTFQLVGTPQQQGEYPFDLQINQKGIPTVILSQAAKDAKGYTQAQEESKKLDQIGGIVSTVAPLAATPFQMAANKASMNSDFTNAYYESSGAARSIASGQRKTVASIGGAETGTLKRDSVRGIAASEMTTKEKNEALSKIRPRATTIGEYQQGLKMAKKEMLARTIAAGINAAGKSAAAVTKSEAAKTKIQAQFAYRGHDSYVLKEDVNQEAGVTQNVPPEAQQNFQTVVDLLNQASQLSFEKFYIEKDGKQVEVDQFPHLLNIYQSILNHIDHFYVIQQDEVKKAIYGGLQTFTLYALKRKEYYAELIDLFNTATVNTYLVNPEKPNDIEGKNLWHSAIAQLGFVLFNTAARQHNASITIPSLFGSCLWLPEEIKDESAWISFEAKGQDDLFVIFSQNITYVKNPANNLYEIVFGIWNNTKTEIHVTSFGRPAAQINAKKNKNAVLSDKKYQPFWLQYKKGTIEIGSGQEVGKNQFMTWKDPYPYKNIKYIGIGTWISPIKIRKIKTNLGQQIPKKEEKKESTLYHNR